MNPMSDDAFKWFISALTAGVAGTWFVYDALKLWWLRRADRQDPTIRDKHFGYAVGVVVGAVGLIGVLRFHGVI